MSRWRRNHYCENVEIVKVGSGSKGRAKWEQAQGISLCGRFVVENVDANIEAVDCKECLKIYSRREAQ